MFDVSNGFNGINVCGDTNWSYLFIDVINDAGDSDIKKKKNYSEKFEKKWLNKDACWIKMESSLIEHVI